MESLTGPGIAGSTPASRIAVLNDAPVRGDGEFVLYWMTTARRTRSNFALQRAVELASELERPLVVFEALRAGYPWASDRLHQFVIDGMRDNAEALASTNAYYYPYLEPKHGDAQGLIESLAARACTVVTDDYPAFFIPEMLAATASRLPVRLEAVDSNGVRPMRASTPGDEGVRAFTAAYHFRRALQRALPTYLDEFPQADPLAPVTLPVLTPDTLAEIERRWPQASLDAVDLSTFAIDHSVPPSEIVGGARAAHRRIAEFVQAGLSTYGEGRNHPDEDGQSGLSPYLHFGHLGAHEVVSAILEQGEWSFDRLSADSRGAKKGWWGLGAGAEAFLDEVITWRELGFNACVADPRGYDQLDSIPDWAQRTLSEHTVDQREHLYHLETLAAAQTDDPVWNAVQRQLLTEGRIHNYLRMLWGKRALEWTATPQEAFDILVELNNRYALDGRDPNSSSGILWCFGKYDRPWGPERPIFGTVRYMTSANTVRKLRMREYLHRFGAASEQGRLKL